MKVTLTNSRLRRRMWIGGALPLALTACAGSAPSDLFNTPLTTAVGEPPPSPAIDAGAVDSAAPASSLPSVPANVDSGMAPEAQDSGLTLVQGLPDATVTPATCPIAGKAPTMIDDGSWPGDNASILPQCGRIGGWYVFNDGVSEQSPGMGGPFGPFLTDSPPNGASGYVRTWGTLSESSTSTSSQPHWGAGFGFDLDNPDGTARPYGVEAYQGFSFWFRTGPNSEITSIRFGVPTSQTVSYPDGAYYGFSFSAPTAGAWVKVTVPFMSLTQPSWTLPSEEVPFDVTAVLTLQWNFSSGGDKALGFDVSIGDVELW